MKPVILSISSNNPTTIGGKDGKIVLTGLTAGTAYGVSYKAAGVPQNATLTSDENGNITIGTVGAGAYTDFVVTDTNGNSSDANTTVISLSDPVATTGSTNTGGDGGPVPTNTQEVINDYLANSSGDPDPREAVMVGTEALIADVRKTVTAAKGTNQLPATAQMLDFWQKGTITIIENSSVALLDKLTAAEAETAGK